MMPSRVSKREREEWVRLARAIEKLLELDFNTHTPYDFAQLVIEVYSLLDQPCVRRAMGKRP